MKFLLSLFLLCSSAFAQSVPYYNANGLIYSLLKVGGSEELIYNNLLNLEELKFQEEDLIEGEVFCLIQRNKLGKMDHSCKGKALGKNNFKYIENLKHRKDICTKLIELSKMTPGYDFIVENVLVDEGSSYKVGAMIKCEVFKEYHFADINCEITKLLKY